jgi:isocitrate dehydrogenase
MYWAQELAAQNEDQDLKKQFAPIAKELESKVDGILEEIKAARGRAQDGGGYYRPDPAKVKAAMRPSATLNAILDRLA